MLIFCEIKNMQATISGPHEKVVKCHAPFVLRRITIFVR
jgi:hypothetical protein